MQDSPIRVGSWLFSREHRESVRVLEVHNLWGYASCQVWVPGREKVEWVRQELLSNKPPAAPQLKLLITYAACAVKIAGELGQNVLLAPLEAGVIPLPHQIRALERAVAGDQVRYLLADEVGLGKTIEAGLIIRELKLRGLVSRVLVVAPKGLVPQWVSEMHTHFGEPFRAVSPAELSAFSNPGSDENAWSRFDQIVCPLDAIKPIECRRGWSQERLEQHNQQRLGDLVAAGWDLIVVDEAHKIGGSSETVARYKLGKALAQAAPYLLLLSATPHQGKSEAFHRLMALLDRDAFPAPDSVDRDKVVPFVIRTEKRLAINDRGEPLFQPRTTRMISVKWHARHAPQQQLYEAVTEYVREGYNRAVQEQRQYLGFLMILMQRLVTSSTRAIATALDRRLETLMSDEDMAAQDVAPQAEWYDQDGQELLETLLAGRISGDIGEIEEVRLLLTLAQRAEAQAADARADVLLELLYTLQSEENNPDLKFLIFTEFVPTQEMLEQFLHRHGFSVTTLNGSMTLPQRQQAQRRFAADARILVSTDAGGEGLNLQFAHIVINYDLPWNPMRVEQRIGRVDRIGQLHPVKAFNLLLDDSVELRVHEILQEKLQTIFDEFGVDKTGDVLDSEDAGAFFEQAMTRAILDPQHIEAGVEELVSRVRERAQEEAQGRSMYEIEPLDAKAAARVRDHPIQYWLKSMVTASLAAYGGRAHRNLLGWDLTWPDGTQLDGVSFCARDAVAHGLHHLGFQDERLHRLIRAVPTIISHEQVSTIRMTGLPRGIRGHWSLW